MNPLTNVAPSGIYTPSVNVRFGAEENVGHSKFEEMHMVNSHWSMNSAPHVHFGSGQGWVPFGSSKPNSAHRLNVVA